MRAHLINRRSTVYSLEFDRFSTSLSRGTDQTILSRPHSKDELIVGFVVAELVPATEKAAINALVSRIGQHEDGHVSISKTGRTGFALSMKGKPESDLDTALETQRCNVAWLDRDFDNKEGDIGLASDNTVTVKGKDHPEYTAGCPPRKR